MHLVIILGQRIEKLVNNWHIYLVIQSVAQYCLVIFPNKRYILKDILFKLLLSWFDDCGNDRASAQFDGQRRTRESESVGLFTLRIRYNVLPVAPLTSLDDGEMSQATHGEAKVNWIHRMGECGSEGCWGRQWAGWHGKISSLPYK